MLPKVIREGLTFDDVLLVPRRSEVLPKEVKLVWGMQALVGLPSMRTWQVPQAPSLHPSFTEVRYRVSRR